MNDLVEPQATLILPGGIELSPDGTVLDTETEAAVEILNARDSVRLVQTMQRKIGDLPDIPDNMNPICCIMAYSMVGLDNDEIAKCLNTEVSNIERIKSLDAYKKFEEMFDERVFEDEKRSAQHILSKASARAAHKVVSLVESKSGDLALAAASKVLSTTGIDKSNENRGMSTLQILLVDEEDNRKKSIAIKVS